MKAQTVSNRIHNNHDRGIEMNTKSLKRMKPCKKLRYCPYGVLVEQFPMPETDEEYEAACTFWGHVCPVFCEGVRSAVVDDD